MTVATEQFRYLQQFVMARSAIVLAEDKHYLVDFRLAPLARSLGVKDANGVVDHLRSRQDPKLEEQVVEAMTTNETSWFRDLRPFDLLKRHLVPEVMAHNATARHVRVWSAACSSGQELYSVAILLEDGFPELRNGWEVDLVGTDISGAMVRRANEGLFGTLEVNRGLPASLLVKYFDQEGAGWRASHALKARTRFSRLNLVGPWPSLPAFDILLLRNVLIYFDVGTRRQILCRAARQLAPGGALMLGTAETPAGLCDELEPVNAEGTVYYRLKRG